MKQTIYSFEDYKRFIRRMIDIQDNPRGYQGRMAEAVRCPKSYFSQVLNAKAHLSSDQALRLCQFWALNEQETEYFLELVNLARTDYPPMISRTKRRLKAIRNQAGNLAERFSSARSLDSNKEIYYYSVWYWSAIHILVGVNGFQTPESIGKRLNLPLSIVKDTLSKLEGMKLITFDGKKWHAIPGNLHLKKESPMLPIHHANWRQKAVSNSQGATGEDLHYTVVSSHSLADYEKLKQLFLGALDEARKMVAPSPNEELTCLCLDFFKVT